MSAGRSSCRKLRQSWLHEHLMVGGSWMELEALFFCFPRFLGYEVQSVEIPGSGCDGCFLSPATCTSATPGLQDIPRQPQSPSQSKFPHASCSSLRCMQIQSSQYQHDSSCQSTEAPLCPAHAAPSMPLPPVVGSPRPHASTQGSP